MVVKITIIFIHTSEEFRKAILAVSEFRKKMIIEEDEIVLILSFSVPISCLCDLCNFYKLLCGTGSRPRSGSTSITTRASRRPTIPTFVLFVSTCSGLAAHFVEVEKEIKEKIWGKIFAGL